MSAARATTAAPDAQPRPELSGAGRALRERVIGGILFLAGAVSVLTTIGIVIVLVWESVGFFRRVPVDEFLTGTVWTPLFEPQRFGVLPLLAGSVLVAHGSIGPRSRLSDQDW